MSTGITRDLSAKMQTDLAAVLERNWNIARHAVNASELAVILLEAAVMLARTAAATVANMAGEDEHVGPIFNGTLSAIVSQIDSSRSDGLTRTMAARREQRS